MKLRRRKKREADIDAARKQLEEAQIKGRKAQEHTVEVKAIVDETVEHTKANGFYQMFSEGLRRGTA